MSDRFNTIAGWTLFAGIVALGAGIVGSKMFHSERPEPMAYAIEGVEAEGGEGAAAAGPSFHTLLAKADVAAGEKIFAKCAACHTITQGGANGVGPNLYGIVGDKKAEGRGGFAFSDALKKVGGTWGFDDLDKWLTSPRDFANGTKMSFAGLSSGQDRANVIAYLNAQGSNQPLPAADAAPAAAAAGGAAGAAAAPAGIEAKLASADPAKGEKVFAKCMACHTIEQGQPNGLGPNLFGIVGDKVAEGRGGFAFSAALKKLGGTWTFDQLDKWLTSPRDLAPGTLMTFAGLGNPDDRANVIAYLASKGGKLPLPKAGAAPAK